MRSYEGLHDKISTVTARYYSLRENYMNLMEAVKANIPPDNLWQIKLEASEEEHLLKYLDQTFKIKFSIYMDQDDSVIGRVSLLNAKEELVSSFSYRGASAYEWDNVEKNPSGVLLGKGAPVTILSAFLDDYLDSLKVKKGAAVW